MRYMNSAFLAATVDGQWRLGIGDPSVYGWLTVIGYALAMVLCWRAGRLSRRRMQRGTGGGGPVFWWVLAAILLFLGVNKQLDLQSLLTQEARKLAKAQGWYGHKEELQLWFIGFLVVAGLSLLGGVGWLCRRGGVERWLALGGMVFLAAFVALRACSFHHIDRLLGMKLGIANLNVALELGGIAVIAVAAGIATGRSPKPIAQS